MNINKSTSGPVAARTEVVELGAASVETHGNPTLEGEFLGHDVPLGIASEETRGTPVGEDEFIGMNADNGISNR